MDTRSICGILPDQPGRERLVIGIYGAGGSRAGDNPALSGLVSALGGRVFKAHQTGKMVDYLGASGPVRGKDIWLFGYSRGGNAAIRLANSLGRKGIAVSKLVTFDPHSLSDNKTFQLKYDNVGIAFNFFQRNPRSAGRFGWWGCNPYWGSPLTSSRVEVVQTDFTGATTGSGAPVSHLNIVSHCLTCARNSSVFAAAEAQESGKNNGAAGATAKAPGRYTAAPL